MSENPTSHCLAQPPPMAYPPFYSSSTPPYYSTITPPSSNPYTPFASFPNPYYYYGKPESTHPYSQFQPPPPSLPPLPYSQPQPPPSYSPTTCFSHGYTPPTPNQYTLSSNPYTPLASLYSHSQSPPPPSPTPYKPAFLPQSVDTNTFPSQITLPPKPQVRFKQISTKTTTAQESWANHKTTEDSMKLTNPALRPPPLPDPSLPTRHPPLSLSFPLNENIPNHSQFSPNETVETLQSQTTPLILDLGTAVNASPKQPESHNFTGRNGSLKTAEFMFPCSLAASLPLEPPYANPIPGDRKSSNLIPTLPPPKQSESGTRRNASSTAAMFVFTRGLAVRTLLEPPSPQTAPPAPSPPKPTDPPKPPDQYLQKETIRQCTASPKWSSPSHLQQDRLDCFKVRCCPLVISTVCVLPISVPLAHYSFSKESLSQTCPTPFDASLDGGNKSQSLLSSTIRMKHFSAIIAGHVSPLHSRIPTTKHHTLLPLPNLRCQLSQKCRNPMLPINAPSISSISQRLLIISSVSFHTWPISRQVACHAFSIGHPTPLIAHQSEERPFTSHTITIGKWHWQPWDPGRVLDMIIAAKSSQLKQ